MITTIIIAIILFTIMRGFSNKQGNYQASFKELRIVKLRTDLAGQVKRMIKSNYFNLFIASYI